MTIEDVARRAGVSRATAARALAGASNVSPEAQRRVRDAAIELRYVPNATARALASGHGTRIVIGVVSPGPTLRVDDYLGRVVTAVAQTCSPHGVGVVVQPLPTHDPVPLRALADDRTVHGLILVNTTKSVLQTIPKRLTGRVVSIGVGSESVPSMDVDNASGAQDLVRHLYATGRRRIVMVTGPRWLPCLHDRVRGYARVMQEAGLPTHTVVGDLTADSGRAALGVALRRWPNLDAIFAICDVTALGVLAALEERGVQVPGDVAVVGFDDIPFAALGSPSLTTARNDVAPIAEAAATALLSSDRGRPLDRLFAAELVLRRSA